jgi:CDP-glucose 4,6-dehydratase
VRVLISVTSDKCYANDAPPAPGEDWRGYREDAPMGGADPYSSSKGAAELVIDAYRRSFFSAPGSPRIASARAGNVIGGGDWATDRLVPDLMQAAIAGRAAIIRNPAAVRPWQHVLNPLGGYLLLAQALWDSPKLAGGWNFGPPDEEAREVGWVAQRLADLWPGGLELVRDDRAHPPEASRLKLDSSKARELLGWVAPLSLAEALAATVDWWSQLAAGADMRAVTLRQIESSQSGYERRLEPSSSSSSS